MAYKWRRQHLRCIVSDPQTPPSSTTRHRIDLFRFTCLYGCFPSPKKTDLVLCHEKGPSTTIGSQGSTIADFFENRQALYLRFYFFKFRDGRGWSVKRSRWPHFVANGPTQDPRQPTSNGHSRSCGGIRTELAP